MGLWFVTTRLVIGANVGWSFQLRVGGSKDVFMSRLCRCSQYSPIIKALLWHGLRHGAWNMLNVEAKANSFQCWAAASGSNSGGGCSAFLLLLIIMCSEWQTAHHRHSKQRAAAAALIALFAADIFWRSFAVCRSNPVPVFRRIPLLQRHQLQALRQRHGVASGLKSNMSAVLVS